MSREEITQKMIVAIQTHLKADVAKVPKHASRSDFWEALSRTIVQMVAEDWENSRALYSKKRYQYYFSAEFLVGRSTLNNLVNLNIYDEARDALAHFGQDINEILEEENDAALGNGGLGRLAACFLDSSATMDLPVMGYGLLYRYGLFRQQIDNGFQKEFPDAWMEKDYPFIVRREENKRLVRYQDFDVWAVPYDLPITGYNTRNVNTLRLWKAEPAQEFDFNLFNSQRFDDAVRERNRVEDIWRVLYPNDTSYDGKVLRVRQQYFFVSAGIQDIIARYKREHGDDFTNFADYNSIQLNDTHPVIGIPELIRLLLEEGLDWNEAWQITTKTFAYTNHTVLPEAMEKWDVSIFQYLFPEIMSIVQRIDEQFRKEMLDRGMSFERVHYMAPVSDGKVHMAWIACYASFSINGVAAMHTEILKDDTLNDWFGIYPERFNNKTNGVTPRRWLRTCNPELSGLLTELLGSDSWVKDMTQLRQLESYIDDEAVLARTMDIKQERKEILADWIYENMGMRVNTEAVFDIQIKRLHEYKRQLLNAFYVLDLYYRFKQNPDMELVPRVFIFGAKSAPGYFRAKAIIKFINEVAKLVNNDPDCHDKLQVVFIPNYNVSKAELLFPAADVSEQISTAGMEASGTGNMKFMMNGALTLGTLDGANVEIVEEVGYENAYIFGARIENMDSTMSYYNPRWQYENVPGLKRVVDSLVDGTFRDGGTGMFQDIYNSLLQGTDWQKPDVYYVLGDFADYRKVRDKMAKDYLDKESWARKCWTNIVRSSRFSSDRTINDYATEVWKIKPVALDEEVSHQARTETTGARVK